MKDEYLVPINTKQPIENTIQFYNTNEGASIEVLRISKDGITANPNVSVDEAAQAILRALDGHIKQLTQRIAAEGEDTRSSSATPCRAWVEPREWRGLTIAECLQIEKDMRKYYDYQHECKTVCLPEFARAIEAKLREKNSL